MHFFVIFDKVIIVYVCISSYITELMLDHVLRYNFFHIKYLFMYLVIIIGV